MESSLRIGILSAAPRSYSTRRLLETVRARGHSGKVLDPNQFSIVVDEGHPQLFYKNKPVSRYDAVVPRIGASITFFGTAVVRQFEQMSVFCVNSARGIIVARDKLRSSQILSRHKVGIPKTAFVKNRGAVLPAIDELGGAPVIIKLLEGTQGIGVILADHTKIAEAIVETLQSARQNVLVQRFVSESRGRDVRAFVVGGKVVAAMRRVASGDEFRSNVHRGGVAEAVDLTPDYEEAAIRAAQVIGLRVAGVDILESSAGPKVMEVNSSPGLEGIEGASGVDVAAEIVKFVENEVLFPEIDVRQRLSVQPGYAVMEATLGPKSNLIGLTIAEARLREDEDVTVLSISRGSEVIPIPRGATRLEQGDVLLCYGRTSELRSLFPRQTGRKKRKKVARASGE